jgi:hypothetical protein
MIIGVVARQKKSARRRLAIFFVVMRLLEFDSLGVAT